MCGYVLSWCMCVSMWSVISLFRMNILLYENSYKPFMVEARKGSSSGVFLPQERGVSIISLPPPFQHASLCLLRKTRMSSSSYRTCPKGTVQALTSRCGLTAPTFCVECTFTQTSGNQRMTHSYRYLNSFCKKQTCRYEQVKDLHNLLRPRDWLLSLHVSAAYCHVPLHQFAMIQSVCQSD